MKARLALLLGLLLAAPAPAVLRYLSRAPVPFPAAYQAAGLVPEDWDPATVRAHLGALGPLGQTVLGCADGLTGGEVLVVFLEGREKPRGLDSALAGRGFPSWEVMLHGDPTARWVQTTKAGLFLVRVDELLHERGGGSASTLPGLVAHELTHVAQGCWGGLGNTGRGKRLFHDQEDETEALLVETLVNQRVLRQLRRNGRRLTRAENAELRHRADRKGLAAMRRRVKRSRFYRHLPAGPLDDPARHRRSTDPFSRLEASPAAMARRRLRRKGH